MLWCHGRYHPLLPNDNHCAAVVAVPKMVGMMRSCEDGAGFQVEFSRH